MKQQQLGVVWNVFLFVCLFRWTNSGFMKSTPEELVKFRKMVSESVFIVVAVLLVDCPKLQSWNIVNYMLVCADVSIWWATPLYSRCARTFCPLPLL